MKKYMIVFLLLTVIIVSGCSSSGSLTAKGSESITGARVGDKAPDFTVTTTEGGTIKLSDLVKEGKPVVLYFFATWCSYCGEELTNLKNIYPQYSDKVVFAAVSLDLFENQEVIKKYKDKRGFAGDFSQGNREILSDYNVISTTTKYAIDKNGIVQYRGVGILSNQNWNILFSQLPNY